MKYTKRFFFNLKCLLFIYSCKLRKLEEEKRKIYFEKIQSLQTILLEEYLSEAILERNYYLESGKAISRIWVEKLGVSLNNKNTWPEIFDFFNETMSQFEVFFYEYQDYINDLELNT